MRAHIGMRDDVIRIIYVDWYSVYVKNAMGINIELNNLFAIENVSKRVEEVVIGEVSVHIVKGRIWIEPKNS